MFKKTRKVIVAVNGVKVSEYTTRCTQKTWKKMIDKEIARGIGTVDYTDEVMIVWGRA